ncbi:MAG: peroxiredoxin [Planctomycetota bacterium]|nr:MAG: peroxiredoxin [Planctomycetota bacterium]
MDFQHIPNDLPIPIDDGGSDHLPSLHIPSVILRSTDGSDIRLDDFSRNEKVVVYCYPMTGRPGIPLPDGWDAIPGARGCTPQSCNFRDHTADLARLGVRVFGLSTQSTEYQQEAVNRLHLPFNLLSDEGLLFTKALMLPTFEVEGRVLLKRLTFIIISGVIEKVFYPVFPPDGNAIEVLGWLAKYGEN